MTEQTWISIIGAAFAGLTSIVTLIFALTDRRRRSIQEVAAQAARDKQEVEAKAARDKLALDMEVAKLSSLRAALKAEELKMTVLESKATREKQINELGTNITAAIEANTSMNEKALDAANGVNVKIQNLGLQLAEQKGIAIGSAQQDSLHAKNVTIEAQQVEVHTDKTTEKP